MTRTPSAVDLGDKASSGVLARTPEHLRVLDGSNTLAHLANAALASAVFNNTALAST